MTALIRKKAGSGDVSGKGRMLGSTTPRGSASARLLLYPFRLQFPVLQRRTALIGTKLPGELELIPAADLICDFFDREGRIIQKIKRMLHAAGVAKCFRRDVKSFLKLSRHLHDATFQLRGKFFHGQRFIQLIFQAHLQFCQISSESARME